MTGAFPRSLILYDVVDEVYTSAPMQVLVYLDAYIYYTIVVAVFLSYFSWPRLVSQYSLSITIGLACLSTFGN